MPLPTVLRERDFRSLLSAQALIGVGDWTATLALLALVLELTGSATAVGGILVLRLLPGAVAWPLASRAVQRWDRRRTLLATSLARAGMIALVPLVAALWWVYAWAFLVELANLVFIPARDSLLPDLVEGDELPLANGLVLGGSYGTIPLGAAAFVGVSALPVGDAGLLGRTHAVAFWLVALLFAIACGLLGHLPRAEPAAPEDRRRREGLAAAVHIPLVRAVGPAAVAASFGLGALFSLGIVFVRDVLDASDTEFGLLMLVFGLGAAAGLGVLQLRRRDVGLTDVRVSVAVMGTVVAVMSLAPGVGWTLAGAAGFGAGAAYSVTAGLSILQRRLDEATRGLALTAFHLTIRLTLAVAALAAGAAQDLLGVMRWPVVGDVPPARAVLLFAGVLVVAASAAVPRRA